MNSSIIDKQQCCRVQTNEEVNDNFRYFELISAENKVVDSKALQDLSEFGQVHTDNYAGIFVSCLAGSVIVRGENTEYQVRAQMQCMWKRGTKVELVHCSKDFHAVCLTVDNPDFILASNTDTYSLLSLGNLLDYQVTFVFSKPTYDILNQLLALIKSIHAHPTLSCKSDMLKDAYCSLTTLICSELLDLKKRRELSSRGDSLFNDFILLVAQHYKQQRQVDFYADKLHITPKYLTTLIKAASQKTARDWIVDFVLAECKRLLQDPKLSVLEICYAMNFANPSFFSHFFKKYVAMTPQQYRESVK